MIYAISEFTATVVDCIILFWFLIFSLSFKESSKTTTKIAVTAIFSAIMVINIIVLNSLYTLEGIFTILYFAILLLFSIISLKGKWWHQLILVLVGLASIFLTNAVITIISSFILDKEFSSLLLMRNPARIFLLVVSKLVLLSILVPIGFWIRKKKVILHLSQSIVIITALFVSITAGIIIEKMILEHLLPVLYASIIMLSLVIINILLFVILAQFTLQNQAALNQVALQTRLSVEEKKIQESIHWSKSIRTLRHDLNNHLISISRYIKDEKNESALEYIKKISGNLLDLPTYTDTSSPTLNAILDIKRMICIKENIKLKCYIQKDLIGFDEVSFSTIFGNIMDNAIEAELTETEKEIRLSIESKGEYLHITVQNKISKPVLVDGELPITTKRDKHNHGLGMYSIAETVSKNNGVLNICEEDGWFIVDILMHCDNI